MKQSYWVIKQPDSFRLDLVSKADCEELACLAVSASDTRLNMTVNSSAGLYGMTL